jgi:hypothetical protein
VASLLTFCLTFIVFFFFHIFISLIWFSNLTLKVSKTTFPPPPIRDSCCVRLLFVLFEVNWFFFSNSSSFCFLFIQHCLCFFNYYFFYLSKHFIFIFLFHNSILNWLRIELFNWVRI